MWLIWGRTKRDRGFLLPNFHHILWLAPKNFRKGPILSNLLAVVEFFCYYNINQVVIPLKFCLQCLSSLIGREFPIVFEIWIYVSNLSFKCCIPNFLHIFNIFLTCGQILSIRSSYFQETSKLVNSPSNYDYSNFGCSLRLKMKYSTANPT